MSESSWIGSWRTSCRAVVGWALGTRSYGLTPRSCADSTRISNGRRVCPWPTSTCSLSWRSEEHTSELQSRENLVCRLLLEKKTTQCTIAHIDDFYHFNCNYTTSSCLF